MYYRANNELIITGARDENGTSTSTFIDRNRKKNQWGKLNYLIGGEMRKNNIDIRWKDEHSHTVNEVFNYCPMILNYIASRGYKRVLFVGHYNSAQRSWTFPRKSDRNLFETPSFRSTEQTMVDPHIWVQFLPIVRHAYRYNFSMHTLVPPESRHRKVMHALYRRYELDLIPCSEQYKHIPDGTDFNITPPPNHPYDCVVFAGVPKVREDYTFTVSMVRQTFKPYCVDGFDIIDLNYQDPDSMKYVNGALHSNSDHLHEAFALRGVWDENYRALPTGDVTPEYNMLDTMINLYRN